MLYNIIGENEVKVIDFEPEHVYVVGYSGSNKEKIYEHIKELEEQLGVAPPKKIPTIFEVSREILTQNEDLYFVDEKTSGECEYVIMLIDSKIYIGLGSDHTDRELESISVPKSKQVCLKPISKDFWKYEDIKDHIRDIKLVSYYDGELYQEGTLADILSVGEIIGELETVLGEIDNCIIFSGTVPLVGGYKYGKRFEMKLIDETLNNEIVCNYDVNIIPREAR